MKLPSEIGPIHFVGIGGIDMSGIAEVLLNLGHKVRTRSARPAARRGCCRDDAGAVVRRSQGTSIARGPRRSQAWRDNWPIVTPA